MKYIAIDIGSSFIKSAILDMDNYEITKCKSLAMPLPASTENGVFEVDANQIYDLIKAIIDSNLQKYANENMGVLFSTQMHGFVLADGRGMPLSHYISWQDERCLQTMPSGDQTYLQYLKSIISREDMRDTGVYLKAPLALCNLYVLLSQGFAVVPNANFCTLGSYIIFRLTGRNMCHMTNAAPTGFADVVNKSWNKDLIEKAKAGGLVFPELVADFEACAYYQYNARTIPVYSDIGDQQACVLGCMARPEQDVNINIGTAAQISVIHKNFNRQVGELRPYFDGYYLNTVSSMPGGRNLDVLINFLKDIGETIFNSTSEKSAIWNKIMELLRRPDAKGLKVDASFYKTLESDVGSIMDITSSNLTVKSLFSAVFNNIAVTYKQYMNRLCQDQNAIERIVFSGGVAGKNPVLLNEISTVTGLRGVLPPTQDEVFVGLFRVALVCTKICENFMDTYDFLVIDRESNKIKLSIS